MAFLTKKSRAGGAHALSDVPGQCDLGMSCGARDTRPSCCGGGGGGSDSDDDDDDNTMYLYADSGEGSMGLEADAGTFLKITGDAGGCGDKFDSIGVDVIGDSKHRQRQTRRGNARHRTQGISAQANQVGER